jgi:hypothetical protein
MSVRLPKPNIFDKFLKMIGKKRGVRIPVEGYERYGPCVYAVAYKESFWRAIFRPNTDDLPDGTVEIFSISEIQNSKVENASSSV